MGLGYIGDSRMDELREKHRDEGRYKVCDGCCGNIYEGEIFYRIADGVFCEDCIYDAKERL